MTHSRILRGALTSTALVAPIALAGVAHAQSQQTDQLAPNCAQLVEVSDQLIADVETRSQLESIADRNVEADCIVAIERLGESEAELRAATDEDAVAIYEAVLADIEAEVGIAASAAASDTATLEVERRAVAVGQVAVTQGAASVDVQDQAAEVEVTPGQPEVDVNALAGEIVVRQKQPTITLAMPQPTISIDMPAPDIYVTMPNPDVAVSSSAPQVDVRQAEPEVAVRVPEPEVAVDVEARIVNPNTEEGAALIESARSGPETTLDTAEDEEASINIASAQPNVTVNESGEPVVNVGEAPAPTIRYEPAQPQVRVQGQPQIEFNTVGEPNVILETAEQRSQRMQDEQRQAQAQTLPWSVRLAWGAPPVETDADVSGEIEAAAEDAEQAVETAAGQTGEAVENAAEATGDAVAGAAQEVEEGAEYTAAELSEETRDLLQATDETLNDATQMGQIAVREILGYDVYNATGAELGDAERVVMNNGQLYLVVEHGGFLGIGGEEVALPMERVTLRGDQLILEGLTEEDLEAMPSYDRDSEQELGSDEMVDMGVL